MAAANTRYRVRVRFGAVGSHLILWALAVLCLIPMVLVISASFSDDKDVARYGYQLIPAHFTAFAYQYILKAPTQVINAYAVTATVTAVGTATSLAIMSLLAYTLSRPEFTWRRPLSFFVFFTMLFNGGLVPFYILMTQYLHLQDSLLSLILPYLVSPFYVLLLRTYFSEVPRDLLDAARIDGADEWRIFFRVVVPMSTTALATVGLFCALTYWNDWWLALLFIRKPELEPLQYMLYTILTNIQAMMANPMSTGIRMPVGTVRMAMAVLAAGPAVLAFMLVQRYFISGITIGAIKE
jgi:putative aldouronate transport system permease protein